MTPEEWGRKAVLDYYGSMVGPVVDAVAAEPYQELKLRIAHTIVLIPAEAER